jgi:beta-hydroxyacyl-ACP dehydratase FabZ
MESKIVFDIAAIQKMLPHRYPFLLVDRVIECQPEENAVGIKNVSMNEWFFAGHFPCEPVMPGVLIVEALAQLSGIVMLSSKYGKDSFDGAAAMYFVKIDNAVFKDKVVPGDTLILHSKKIRGKMGMYIFECAAYVGEKLVTTAQIVATAG